MVRTSIRLPNHQRPALHFKHFYSYSSTQRKNFKENLIMTGEVLKGLLPFFNTTPSTTTSLVLQAQITSIATSFKWPTFQLKLTGMFRARREMHPQYILRSKSGKIVRQVIHPRRPVRHQAFDSSTAVPSKTVNINTVVLVYYLFHICFCFPSYRERCMQPLTLLLLENLVYGFDHSRPASYTLTSVESIHVFVLGR